MHVGMRDGDGEVLDAHQQDMGIGRADIVLDEEPRPGADRDRIEPGMVEFQAAGAVEPAHEGANARLVLGLEPISAGASDHLLSALRGKRVERLVQIHDETMQAVARAARHRGQLGDVGLADLWLAEAELRRDGGKSILYRGAFVFVGDAHRLDHRLDIGKQGLGEVSQALAPRSDRLKSIAPLR